MFLLSALLCLPFVAYVPWIGDEGIMLHAGQRMLAGRRVYADFFEFHTPGTFLIAEAWLRVAGASILSIRVLSTACVAAVALLTYLCCARVSGRRWASAALALAWVGCTQGKHTQLSHQYFTTALSMASFLAVVGGRTPAAGRAGVFAGAAAMTTSGRGALAVLAALASLGPRWRSWLIFAAGVAAIPAACTAYLLWRGVLDEAIQDIFVWTARRYTGIQAVRIGAHATAEDLPLVLAYPLAVLALLMLLVTRRGELKGRLVASIAFAVCGLVGSFPRPDDWHMSVAAPLILPLLALGWDALAASAGRFRWVPAAAAGLALAPAALAYGHSAKHALSIERVDTPAGAVAFEEEGIGPIVRQLAPLPKSDHFFFYPYMPLLPVLTHRDHVAKVDLFTPHYTTPEQYDAACREVMGAADWVVFDRLWTDPRHLRAVFPAMREATSPASLKLEAALARGFAPSADTGRFLLMKRTPAAGQALCGPPPAAQAR